MRLPARLFVMGLVVHILYNLIIYFTGSQFTAFLQPDNGQLTGVLSDFVVDTRSYIESADNYAEHGIFGQGTNPDYHRTIGYPMIIYFFKLIAGQYWYVGLVAFQTIISAFIYPLTYLIGKIILKKESRSIYYASILTLLMGAYFTRTLFVLSDLLCAFFFILGIYTSMLSVIGKNKILLMSIAVVSISFACLIRPVLVLYPVVNFLLLLLIAKTYGNWKQAGIKRLVIISSLALLIACNYSSFRIYHSYKTFSSTDVLSINMLYTVKSVLNKNGESDNYLVKEREINKEDNWQKKGELRKKYFLETIKKYPVNSISYWLEAASNHFLTPHFIETGNMYGYYKRDFADGQQVRKKSFTVKVVFYVFFLFNLLIILIPFSLFLLSKFRQKNYLFVITILLMIVTIMVPTFIASTGPRMRLLIEPFLILFAFEYLSLNGKKHIDFFRKILKISARQDFNHKGMGAQ